MRPIVMRRDFLDGQLPVDRAARSGDAAADQRLQPAGDQRHRAATSGTTSPRSLQEPARGRQGHGPPPVHRRAVVVRDARRRARLHPAGVAGQPLVDRAVPAEQHGRHRSTGAARSPDRMESFDDAITQMLWPEKREGNTQLSDRVPASRIRASSTSPPRRSYLTVPAGYLPTELLAPLDRPARRWLLPNVFERRRHRSSGRSPKGTPVNLLSNIDSAEAQRAGRSSLLLRRSSKRPQGAAARMPPTRRRARSSRNAGAEAARASASARLRGQQGPLLRHRLPAGE